jgi:hypothetical protein
MPLTVAAKNLMLNALKGTNPATPITHAGLLDAATPITTVTGTASTNVFNKNTHGLSNGDLVVLSEMTVSGGGANGLAAGDAGNVNNAAEPLFVINQAANTFELSRAPGGSAVDFTADVSAVTVTKLVEISGGSPAYTRETIAFNNAADGAIDDSTNGAVFDIPAGATVDYSGLYSASTSGTLLMLTRQVSETFAGQGTYTLTDADVALI